MNKGFFFHYFTIFIFVAPYLTLPNLFPLAMAGFVVASVEHRSSETAAFPAAVEDVKAAIRFLRQNADEYGILPDQVAVFGDSSGGHLSLMVGLTGDGPVFRTDDYSEQSDAVKAIIDFYGPSDVTHIHDGPRNPEMDLDKPQPEDIFFGGRVLDHPELAAPGNPLRYVTKDREIPPVLIAHGAQDDVVPFCQSVILYDKLVECGKQVEFYKVLSASHGFYMWTEEMMHIVISFLGMHLKG